MRILVVAPPYNSTPPRGYGGIQRVVHALIEQLARLGHDVILVAPPRSRCSGRTVEVLAYDPDRAWRPVRQPSDLVSEEPLYEAVRDLLAVERVDVIHDWSFRNLFVQRHPERAPFVISSCVPPFPGETRPNLVACSRAHAGIWGGQTRHVHYGLPLAEWAFSLRKTKPAVHIAKIARFKAQHLAILAARRARVPLTLVGNVEDPVYYHGVVRPLLWLTPKVRYVGEVQGTGETLREAAALVQTPRWFDAFPLVVLEALASATPVIAFAEGGIPEQIVHGKTGFLCHGFEDLAEAFDRLSEIEPAACRADAEARFSVRKMADAYLDLYQSVQDGARW